MLAERFDEVGLRVSRIQDQSGVGERGRGVERVRQSDLCIFEIGALIASRADGDIACLQCEIQGGLFGLDLVLARLAVGLDFGDVSAALCNLLGKSLEWCVAGVEL